jgi:hypothetical protein
MDLKRYSQALACCMVLLSAGGGPAAAQQFSISHRSSSTDLRELASAAGIAFALAFPAGPVSLGATMHRQTYATSFATDVCVSYERRVGCRVELVRRDARLSGFGVTAGLPVRLLSRLEVEAGAGVTLNQVRADDTAESGRPTALFNRPSGQWGGMASLSARVQPLRSLPITLDAGLGEHRIQLRGCGEYPWDDDPFCGTFALRDVRIGASLNFRL